jgi:hypothetical protein
MRAAIVTGPGHIEVSDRPEAERRTDPRTQVRPGGRRRSFATFRDAPGTLKVTMRASG